jgi:hypothetical protein
MRRYMFTLATRRRVVLCFKFYKDVITNTAEAMEDGNMRNREESKAAAKRFFGNTVVAHTSMEPFEKFRRNAVVAIYI